MARPLIQYYTPEVICYKKAYYDSLPEKAKRHFLAQEYLHLGPGSKSYLARIFDCSRQTITKGVAEIIASNFNPDYSKQRTKGGGRKKKEDSISTLTEWVLSFVEAHTAGSPTDASVKWTALKPKEIAAHLRQTYQVHISNNCIKRILKAEGYVKRKPIKCIATGSSEHRAAQFKIVLYLVALFHGMEDNPILSIDTKKKEKLGQLTRNETVLTKKNCVPKVYSSDYPSLATGRAIPHGIYDVKLVKGYLSIGISYEVADFIIDNLHWWWTEYGQYHYQDANHILLLADCGGANSYRHHRFKVVLQRLAKKIGIRIVMAHYPPYCSKYNPIERKLFCHVHRTIQNTILIDVYQVKELMSKTTHAKGLSVHVRINPKVYSLGLPSNKEDIDESRILRHPVLPQFSYTVIP